MPRLSSVRRLLLVPLLTILVAGGSAAAQEPFHPSLDGRAFPVPDALVPNVEFWRAVFARYESTQTVIHDDEHLDVVFAVVDVGDLVRRGATAAAIEITQRARVRDEIHRYQQVLRRLGGDGSVGGQRDRSGPGTPAVRRLAPWRRRFSHRGGPRPRPDGPQGSLPRGH